MLNKKVPVFLIVLGAGILAALVWFGSGPEIITLFGFLSGCGICIAYWLQQSQKSNSYRLDVLFSVIFGVSMALAFMWFLNDINQPRWYWSVAQTHMKKGRQWDSKLCP